MYTIDSLYTDEEIRDIAQLTQVGQRGHITALIASYSSNFDSITARMGAREGAPNFYFGSSPEVEQMVRILLRPTNRAVGREHQLTLNEIFSRILNLHGHEGHGNPVSQSLGDSSHVNDEVSEATAGSHEGTEVNLQTIVLLPSPAHAAALRYVVERLDIHAFGTANLFNNDPNTKGLPAPNHPSVIRRLYTPAEIEAIYEIVQLNWPPAPDGSRLSGTVVQLLQTEATEQTRSLHARVLGLLFRPIYRNTLFNGDTTLSHGISPFVGGVSRTPGATNPSGEAIAERNRTGATTVGLFLRAANNALTFSFEDDELMGYPVDEGNGMAVAEIVQSYTAGELDELHDLFGAIYGDELNRNRGQTVSHYDGDFYRDIDERAAYRLRVEEIIYRPVARAQEAEERRHLDETRENARMASRGPALGEAGPSRPRGSNITETEPNQNANSSSRYHVRTRPTVETITVRQAQPNSPILLAANSGRPRTYAGDDGQADITHDPRSGTYTIDGPPFMTFPGAIQHAPRRRTPLPEPELVDEDLLNIGHTSPAVEHAAVSETSQIAIAGVASAAAHAVAYGVLEDLSRPGTPDSCNSFDYHMEDHQHHPETRRNTATELPLRPSPFPSTTQASTFQTFPVVTSNTHTQGLINLRNLTLEGLARAAQPTPFPEEEEPVYVDAEVYWIRGHLVDHEIDRLRELTAMLHLAQSLGRVTLEEVLFASRGMVAEDENSMTSRFPLLNAVRAEVSAAFVRLFELLDDRISALDQGLVIGREGGARHMLSPRASPGPATPDAGHTPTPALGPITWTSQILGEEEDIIAIQAPPAIPGYGPMPYRTSLNTTTLRAFSHSLMHPGTYNDRTIRLDDPDPSRASIRFILDFFTDQNRERMWVLMNGLYPYRNDERSRDDITIGDFVQIAQSLDTEQAREFLDMVARTQMILDDLVRNEHVGFITTYDEPASPTPPRTSAHWGGPWQPLRGGPFGMGGAGPPPRFFNGPSRHGHFQNPGSPSTFPTRCRRQRRRNSTPSTSTRR
jgi:hypothetical protein